MKDEFQHYNLIHTHGTHTHTHTHEEHKPIQIEKNKKNLKTPVTVIGGFLGAGKTSLVNHILSNYKGKKVDVLVREYGSVSIDDMLINVDKKQIHVFPGVSMHFDPQIMLYGYMDRLSEDTKINFDHLLMESSGLDWPEYMIKLFYLGKMRDEYRLASYITIVDAEFAHLNIDEYPLVKDQIAYADIILLNKVDMVSEATVNSIKNRLRHINGYAKIYDTEFCRADVDKIMDIELYEQLKDLDILSNNYKGDYPMEDIKTIVLSEITPMDKEKINKWLENLFKDKTIKLLRSKGFFCFKDSDYRYEFQGVRTSFHSKADKKWQENEERKTTVVIIGEGLDENKLKFEFGKCV